MRQRIDIRSRFVEIDRRGRGAHAIERVVKWNPNRMRFVHIAPDFLQIPVDNSHHIGNLRRYTCGMIFVNGTFPGLLPGRPAGGDRPGVNGAGGDGAGGGGGG